MNAHIDPSRLPQTQMFPQAHPVPRHDAVELTGGGVLALIELNGQTYSLRITRAGKLILTK